MARPREFDEGQALDKAMRLFWSKGYHDSSIRDLVEATGVNQYGLYSVFDDKRGMFLAALDRYGETVTRNVIEAIQRPGPIVPTLEKAFGLLIGFMTARSGGTGCMMCNTGIELGPHDAEIAGRVKAHMKRLEDAFGKRLSQAVDAGELPGDLDRQAIAEFLVATAYTLGVLARSGKSRAAMTRHVHTALRALA